MLRFRLVPLALIALGALLLIAQAASAQATHRVDVVRVDGTITPPMARYIGRAISRAADDGAAAVVLELDTPGGLSASMDEIIDDILQSEVPVVVYVAPRGARAASAGVFISYAAHVAAMAPGTRIGSASPIMLGDDGSASDGNETLTRKVTNDAVSQIKGLAQLRGRNAEWAERAVRDAANVTSEEAHQLGVVDLLAPDVPSLLQAIDGREVQVREQKVRLATAGAEIRDVEMGWMEQFMQLLADPTIAYILLSLGSIGLFFELSNPGAILPGVVGGLFLLLALYGLGTLPVNWAGVLLIGFGFLLLAIDLFVPSFGSLTIGGLASFVIGSHMLIGEEAPPG
nr:nodulation protein NfeD [Chloroflexia bacterium]